MGVLHAARPGPSAITRPPDAVLVTLTRDEWRWARQAGLIRADVVATARLQEVKGSRRDNIIDRHCLGCVTEFAASKWTGLYWPGPGNIGGPDLGGFAEVRSAGVYHDHDAAPDLKLKQTDKIDAPYLYVLPVVGDALTYRLMGWIQGRDARTPPRHNPALRLGPGFCVPITALRPMTDWTPRQVCGRSDWPRP